MEALQAEALRRAKEMLVLREIMAAQTFPVTPEELEAEAAAIARRPVSYTHLTLPTILLV